MPGLEYFQEKRKFQDTYGFSEEFETMDARVRSSKLAYKHLPSLNAMTEEMSAEGKEYLNGLMNMLNQYIETRLTPVGAETSKIYSLEGVDVMGLITDYEKVISLKNDGNKSRQPYEGIEDKILQVAETITKDLNKPLVDIWADRIKSGTYNLNDLREHTKTLGGIGGVGVAKNAYMINKALEKISDERTLGWKLQPWHWFRMLTEYLYKRELTSDLETFNGAQSDTLVEGERHDVEALTSVYNNPMMDESVSMSIAKTREEKFQETVNENQQQIEEKDDVKVPFVVDSLAETIPGKDVATQQKIVENPEKVHTKDATSL